MSTGTLSGSKLPTSKKFGSSMTQRFSKANAPGSTFKQRMYVENALLRESRKLSQNKNKYM